MPDKRENKVVQYRKSTVVNIGTILFGILFIYMVICMIIYLNAKHITAYEVTVGPLAGNYQYKAIAIRTEEIVSAPQNGNIRYYAREGAKVGKGNAVCSINLSEAAPQVVHTSDESSEVKNKKLLSRIHNQIASFSSNYKATSYQSVYDFKSDMESSILELTNDENISSFDGNTLSPSRSDLSTAPTPGIVVYSTDGYEALQPQEVKLSDFDQNNYQKDNLRLHKSVKSGSSIYKLVTDEHWSLVFPIDEKMMAELSEKNTITVRFLKDNTTSVGNCTVLTNQDGYYGKVDVSTSMVRFFDDRFLEIELILQRTSGLKIPKSAIAERTFYKIPKKFTSYREENPSEIRLLKQVQKKDGSYTSKTITATVYNETKNAFYVENTLFSDGDVLLMNDSSQVYTIGTSKTLKGVYNINKGYAIFREIEILAENEEYCIVGEGTTFGLSQYDHIALDASTVSDQDIVIK